MIVVGLRPMIVTVVCGNDDCDCGLPMIVVGLPIGLPMSAVALGHQLVTSPVVISAAGTLGSQRVTRQPAPLCVVVDMHFSERKADENTEQKSERKSQRNENSHGTKTRSGSHNENAYK